LGGSHRIPLRDIAIDDLLQRDAVELDQQGIAGLLAGRTVLVTGAGGSIGSEICRQVLRFQPRTLVLLGRGENRIFAIEGELRELATETRLCPCIGDITDPHRMRQLFQQYTPEVIFHAAAHKHVPLMEANVREAVKNNILGTKSVADLAVEYRVRSFVLISTDKAVRPTSVMGATKQLAERYVYALSQQSRARFSVVRFGNVLGSAGSVVPLFQDQIRRGGPITVTDRRMVRFFMTIPEASQLVLQAAAMGKGGEIFVLDMGAPVRILDLARDLIRLSGLPEEAIDITFTGIRPGEKLYEEIHVGDERILPTAHPSLLSAYPHPYALAEVGAAVARLADLLNGGDAGLRECLLQLIPDFQPNGRPDPRPPASAQDLQCTT
jgi:FlaA1/EpsC-like NDP-sugar epimerase